MDSTYRMLYFIDDNTVEGVPNSWVKDDDETCAWLLNNNIAPKMIE